MVSGGTGRRALEIVATVTATATADGIRAAMDDQ